MCDNTLYMRIILVYTILFFAFFSVKAQFNTPVLPAIADITLKEGQLKEFYVTATDLDLEPLYSNPKIVVMGSSTTVGKGASSDKTTWVALFDQHLTSTIGNHTIIKLAQSGYSSYEFREDGFISPIAGRPLPDAERNITKALSYNPDIIIVNIPSNDVANGYSNSEFYANLNAIQNLATAAGVKIYFHTTQPRSSFPANLRNQLFEQSSYIKTNYPNVIATYDSLADLSTNKIMDAYNFDGIHVNDLGHAIIYRQTIKALQKDVIGDVLKFTFTGLPSFVTVSALGKDSVKLIVNPSFQQSGVYPVQVQVTDLLGHTSQQTFSITVQNSQSLSGMQLLTNFHYNQNNGGQMDYYVYYPEDYDRYPENRPVLISIHGAAERAGSPTAIIGDQLGGGSPANLINHGAALPMMIFSPHQQSFIGGVYNQTWNIKVLKEFVEHVKNTYSVDEERIFITGFSNGAQAAWQYAVDYPEDVAALVAVSGRTDLIGQSFNVNLQDAPNACRLSGIPIQVFHGSSDVIINKAHSQDMVNAIGQCNPTPVPPVNFTLISGMDHDGARPFVYSNITGADNIYDWMLQAKGSQVVADVTPPTFINNTPTSSSITEEKFSFWVDLNEKAKVYYAIYTSDFTPTVDQIKQGLGAGLVSYGVVDDTYSANVSVVDLSPSTPYYVWILAEDKASAVNTQTTATLLRVTTLAHIVDTEAPLFTQLPQKGKITSSDVTVSTRLNESGKLYWALYKKGTNASVDEVLVGKNAIQSGEVAVNTNLFQLKIASLIKESSYTLAFVAMDVAEIPNIQSTVTKIDFTTSAQTAGIRLDQTYQLNITTSNFQSGLSDWNDLGFDNINKSKVFSSLKSVTNASSEFSLTAYSGMEGSTINAVSDNGSSYGAGVYPATVIRHAVYSTGTTKLFFQNMDKDKVYTFSVLGSRNGSGSRKTKYTLNGAVQRLECVNNKQNVAVFDKVAPTATGQFAFEMTKDNASWSYLNALVIEEYTASNGDTVSPNPVVDFEINYNETKEGVQLSWAASTDSDFSSYLVYRSTELTTSNNLLDHLINGKVVQNTYLDVEVKSGQQYFYWIRAVDLAGNYSAPTPVLEINLSGTPTNTINITPPLNLQAIADIEKVTLTWSPSNENIEKHYLVYKSTNDEPVQVIDTVTRGTFFYEDQTVLQDTKYTYWVSGVDSLGNESELSNEVEIETPRIIVPITPPILFSTTSNANGVKLVWSTTSAADFAEYLLYASTSSEILEILTTVPLSLVDTIYQYNLSNEKEDVIYYFALTVSDTLGTTSAPSNVKSGHRLNVTPPEAPKNLQVNLISSNSIELVWGNASETDFAYYQVYRNDELLVTNLMESFYVDENLAVDSSYSYHIIAVDHAGNNSTKSETVEEQTESEPIASAVETIKINATTANNGANLSDWNDLAFNIGLRQQAVYDLYDDENTLTNKTLRVWNGFDGSTINNVSSNGSSLNEGVYPNSVLQYVAYTTGTAHFSINGLNDDFVYDIEIHSGRSGGGSRKTAFEVNNHSQALESMNNKSNTLLFQNISPDNSGTITVSFSKSNSSWGYFNALIIREKPTPSTVRTSGEYEGRVSDELLIYPNPSQGTFTIESNTTWDEPSNLVITDLKGTVLISETVNLANNYELNSQLKMGVYILRLTNNHESYVRQIVVSE